MKPIFGHEHPFVTTDAVVFTVSTKEPGNYRKLPMTELRLLLYKRKEEPFAGKWCLPGSFLNIDELPEDNIKLKLSDKTKVAQCYLEQLYTFCDIGRDPSARVLSIAYLCLLNEEQSDNISGEEWFTIRPQGSSFAIERNGTPLSKDDLGFDHFTIIRTALERLHMKIHYTDLIFRLMPKEFTLTELQNVYETITGRKELAANFRRKINDMVEETDRYTADKGHRPAKIYIQRPKDNKGKEAQ
ncbi:ADP-ribose pyrophosphatase [Candidatus Methanoplasma termitum]|uniref:NudF protein n=1 Tax=Candidatus Methanoplasma termitum TaxID=1577791 RepID=A0A0A7LEX0_9ARCH|nr:NUDIX hydrolase [Candidatus Methanoplasma termitum]AIZ56877.1 ADP-ribose pyrophosphatase [Candidatus Methanoplasma termitum]